MKVAAFRLAMSAALLIGASTVTSATTFYEEKIVCPVGGKKFKTRSVMSNSTFGQRPDGKPYSPLPVYPIPECPDNGFLVFDDEFTQNELLKLEAAIATDEFERMRETETPYFRVWWLKQQIGRDVQSQISSLLVATWETDTDWDRKIRYQSEFVNQTVRMQRTDENRDTWFWYNMRAVNGMRELGYFEEGLSHLAKVMNPEFIPTDKEAMENARFYASALEELLKDKNPVSEPANLVPSDIAIFRCVVPKTPLTPAESQACTGTKIQEAIAQFEIRGPKRKELSGEEAIRFADVKYRGEEGR